MRLSALILVFVIGAAPAMAQAPVCEASASGDIGEVIASVDARGTTTISWAVERREGVGQESDHFARPGLLIDFSLTSDGVLDAPRRVDVLVSRFSESERQSPPPLSSITIHAKAGASLVTWAGNKPEDGQAELAARLKDTWPDELVIDILDKDGRLLASASFDLSKRPIVQKLALQARAKCQA